MNLFRLAQILVAVSVMALAPVGSVASAQTSTTTTTPVTCAIAQGPLTAQQESAVNDYEVQVAKANSRHTPVPMMPDDVFLLIGCISPMSQTGVQPATTASAGSTTPSSSPTSTSTSTSSPTTTTSTPTTVVAQPSTSSSSASTGASTASTTSTFTCPPSGLSKDQLSQINDFEILVARANSKHTPVPQPSPEVAAWLTCQ